MMEWFKGFAIGFMLATSIYLLWDDKADGDNRFRRHNKRRMK